ncbi:helicase-associated domain-containing protein [Paenibacillus sp. FSL K6-2859]|uniref:helicase-associated domain-containing protein n=1 Tax=Paenibacillus sp. FSL K6-2859 TaxID=2921482 RepID=UPI0030FA778F
MNQLSAEALEVLKRLCAAHASQPFDEGKEERLRPASLCRAEQKLAMNELRRAGLLTARHKILGEKLYQIPVEQLSALEQEFFPYQPKFIEGYSVNLSMEAGAGLAVDLFRALLFTAREGLPLTAKGIIHKKNLNRLASQLSFQEKHLAGLSMGAPSNEMDALSAALVVDIMLCLGLITRLKTGYRLDKDMLRRWLQLPETRMTDILYGIGIHRFGSIGPADQHFRYLISSNALISEKWTALPELLDWMAEMNLTGTVTRKELEQSSLNWLRCLTGFGWCELGSTPEGIQCFRWTASKPKLLYSSESFPDSVSEHSNDQFIVQPDFEVLIPPDVLYTVRWVLAECAELLQTDTMWSFRLTREMLVHASERGMPPEEAIAWIKEHALGGLPSVVELSLAQWGKSIGRTSLSEVILLTCQTEEDGAAIAAHPRLQSSLKRIGPLHFLVAPESVEQMRKELFLAGLAPSRMIGEREEEVDTDWSSFHQATETEPELYSLPVLNVELRLLDRGNPFLNLPVIYPEQEEDILLGGENVPQIWSKEWRHYHSSTAQKVMEQGLKWGIKVRFSLKDQMLDFIPSRIKGNPWKVEGYLLYNDGETVEEIELTPEDWKEMKLVIPKRRRNSSSAEASDYGMIEKSTEFGRTLT